MTVAVWLALPLLAIAALGCLVRIVRGPTMLDRAVALDVLVATLVCALAAEAELYRHRATLVIIVVLSFVAFTGSVAMARFADRAPDEEGAP